MRMATGGGPSGLARRQARARARQAVEAAVWGQRRLIEQLEEDKI